MTDSPFELISSHGQRWLRPRSLQLPRLSLGFFARPEEPKSRFKSAERRVSLQKLAAKEILNSLEIPDFSVATLQQKHSTIIYRIEREMGSREIRFRLAGSGSDAIGQGHAGDALITNSPGILLAVKTADCMPVLLIDREREAVGAVHAGWRGALARIIEKTVGEMRREFGSNPKDLIALIGPSIRSCCYEVGEEVEDSFRGAFPEGDSFFPPRPPELEPPSYLSRIPSISTLIAPPGHADEPRKAHLDLIAVAKWQLLNSGIQARQILIADYCTSCRTDLFYSYRKEGSSTGRMIAAIGIREF